MIADIIARLRQMDLELTGEEIADLLWLGVQMRRAMPVEEIAELTEPEPIDQPTQSSNQLSPQLPTQVDSGSSVGQAPMTAYLSTLSGTEGEDDQDKLSTPTQSVVFKTPDAPALRNPLALARSLRPLMQRVPSRTRAVLDEEATVSRIADEKIWVPVLKPAPERWFDLVMVIEESSSVAIWRKAITAWQKLVKHQGAFRDVRCWYLREDNRATWQLYPTPQLATVPSRPRDPKELLEPGGRQLILVISDCVSSLWQQGQIYPLLEIWTTQNPVSLLQLMPERYWERSVLGRGRFVQFGTFFPEPPNEKLWVEARPDWETPLNLAQALKLPVVTFDPDSLERWAAVMVSTDNMTTAGVVFESTQIMTHSRQPTATASLLPDERVKRFRATASIPARQLAGLMAAAPVSLPVARLIQQTMVPNSGQVHLAEVFLSGLVQRSAEDDPNQDTEQSRYEFVPGVRELLLKTIPISEADEVLDRVSDYIARKAGLSIQSFDALLEMYDDLDEEQRQLVEPFAQVTPEVLRRLGGVYAEIADELETSKSTSPGKRRRGTPVTFTPFEFEMATIELEPLLNPFQDLEGEPFESIELQPFEFEVASIEVQQGQVVVYRQPHQAWLFVEDLGNGVKLEMVAIPGGRFVMGSPADELKRQNSEEPKHEVNIHPFLMSKFPITQAQWKVVAALPQLNCELTPNPSNFKGEDRPVERVSWQEVVEFCDRLSQKTGQKYRLPSEAEWEYACRAGTMTPFYFGETITTDLANYKGKYAYGLGSRGRSRGETTSVRRFGVANAFGLYDMHGNVWEWCADCWHENYEGALTDGSAWIDSGDETYRVMRGGSWADDPEICRSAYRYKGYPAITSFAVGFRVVCSASKTL